MKLINLNTWGGVMYEPLMEFIKKNSTNTDIFCLQEVFPSLAAPKARLGKVRSNLFSEIQKVLTNFNGYHAIVQESDVGGLAIFIKKSFVVNKIENVIIFPELNSTEDENDENYFSMGRNLQVIELNYLGKIYTILNFHGIWIAKGKMDTDKRIEQSKK